MSLHHSTLDLTITDHFCGAGGSSSGAKQIPGVTVKVAANHWQLAVDTHAENHPTTDHRCADLSNVDPRWFPYTTMAWFSPECTNHSIAKGRRKLDAQPDLFDEVLPDEAAERSRATMWDVVRFTEHHLYEAVIVENVVDAWNWLPFTAWLQAMDSLGYHHHTVMLNSMHAQAFGPGAPQSRDRMYVVFWRKGNRRPDFECVTSPDALCTTCGPVKARQVFKRDDKHWGRYRAQYVYRCPRSQCQYSIVEPLYRPASDIIDWSLEGTRIGDRGRPLAAKTMARIQAGIDKYWKPLLVPVEGRDGKQAAPVDAPARTMTTRNETGLLVPCGGTWRENAAPTDQPISTRTTRETDGLAFVAELRGGGSKHRPVSDPLCTVTASGNHHGLVTTYYGKGGAQPTDEALPTVTTVEKHALIMRNNTPRSGNGSEMTTPVGEPIRTVTTSGHQSLLDAPRPTIDIDDVRFRMLEPREIVAAMDFPDQYVVLGNRREQVRMAGNAVTPPAARDLVGIVAASLEGTGT